MKSSFNSSNKIPSFSRGEYYGYSNNGDGYEDDESDSNKYDHCDCLRINPLTVNEDKCRKGLDQDSFNDDKKSKRSVNEETNENWNINWKQSSSIATLESFHIMNSIFVCLFTKSIILILNISFICLKKGAK